MGSPLGQLAKREDILNLKSSLENMFGENSLKCSIHKHKKEIEFIYGEKAWM
jgi:hypothetical protein